MGLLTFVITATTSNQAQSSPIKPNQAQSSPIKPNQAQSSLIELVQTTQKIAHNQLNTLTVMHLRIILHQNAVFPDLFVRGMRKRSLPASSDLLSQGGENDLPPSLTKA
jgi:hypothetical protein